MAKDIDDMITADRPDLRVHRRRVGTNAYDRIMRFEAEDITKLVGGVVETDYQLSDDGKTFTFKVRPGQKFHSGDPLTADDIAFSLQRVIKLNKTPAFLIGQFGWTPDNVDGLVKAVDPQTFQMTITGIRAEPGAEPADVRRRLVVDKKVVMAHEDKGDFGYAWLKMNEAGSGAFSMKTWKPNETIIMEPTGLSPGRAEAEARGHPACRRAGLAAAVARKGRRRHGAQPDARSDQGLGRQFRRCRRHLSIGRHLLHGDESEGRAPEEPEGAAGHPLAGRL
jgi:hypothetical protein